MSFTDEKPRYPLIPVASPQDLDFTDYVASFGSEMALIHNVLIRGLNSIHHNTPLVKPRDERTFAGYALAWIETIHGHHHGEETILFPFFQTKFDMAGNIAQHNGFLTQLEVFEEYMKKVSQKKELYDSKKARELVEAFGDTLVEHLHEEIPTISPERLGQFDKKELYAVIEDHAKHIKTHSMTRSFPLVITNHDFKAVPSWPPMPSSVIWIIRNVAYWRHYSYWKFSPFTRYGKPQKYGN